MNYMDYTFVKIITQNADSHKENTIEQETMIDKYIGRGDMFVMYINSNFVSADFRKMRTDSFQKSRTTRFRKIRVVR